MDKSQQKKTANKLEKWLADQLGGRRVPASGALQSWKGDVELPEILIDSKYTLKTLINLLGNDLSKVTYEARQANRDGHLILSFLRHGIIGEHWAVVPYYKDEILFENSPEIVPAKSNKKIGLSFLKGVSLRASKKNVEPSVLVEFSDLAFGTPRSWIIFPFDLYKTHYGANND